MRYRTVADADGTGVAMFRVKYPPELIALGVTRLWTNCAGAGRCLLSNRPLGLATTFGAANGLDFE
jgi:hypothetical protein